MLTKPRRRARLVRLLRHVLCCALLLWQAPAAAVAVIVSAEGAIYDQAITGLRATLPPSEPLARHTADAAARDFPPGPVVAAGTAALDTALAHAPAGTRVLALLVPRRSVEALVARHRAGERPLAALYLDQPLERQARVARAVFPPLERLGVILAKDTRPGDFAAQAPAAADLVVHRIPADANPLHALGALEGRVDALVAVPDRRLYNRRTSHGILLGTYRAGMALVGYSRALVRAGALVSAWQPPAAHGREAGRMLAPHLGAGGAPGWPRSRYSSTYRIAVNEAVARSLGLVAAIDDPAGRRFREGAPIR